MSYQQLEQMGFIYKRLSRHICLVRLYTRPDTILRHIIFPMWIKDGG